jgi:thiol-disulfide isomerase/thioredoxin
VSFGVVWCCVNFHCRCLTIFLHHHSRCGHCKALAPDWDSLAEQYSSSSSVLIGSVDCTAVEAKELCEDYGVQGYPTLKYFKVSQIVMAYSVLNIR